MELVWGLHVRVFKATGGRVGKRFGGMPILLLTTTGRRSGEPRERALMYIEDADLMVVIASNAGEPRHPAWFLNLEANPEVTVEVGGREARMRARVAEGGERESLWRKVLQTNRDYEEYRRRAGEREIPVVVLEPVPGS